MSGGDMVERGTRRRVALFGALLATTTVLVGFNPAPAQAQSEQTSQRQFDIPAQSVREALLVFSQQSDIQVTAQGPLVEGRTSSAISGRMVPAQALSHLLTGTGLTFRFIGTSAVRIETAPDSADGTIQLGAVRVEGTSEADSGASPTSDVTATEDTQSYAAPQVSIGKEDARLIDIPQSITVLTRQQIEDQNILTLPDALRNLTGVTVLARANNNIEILSRGFRVTKVQTDGGVTQVLDTDYFRAVENLSQYDHVELLRGSDGLFSGSGDPSGTINLVRKRPQSEPALEFEAAAGRWNDYRGAIDVSTPLTSNFGARFVASYRDREKFLRSSAEKQLNLYGVFEYKPSEMASVRLGGSYERIRSTGGGVGVGLPRYQTGEEVEEFSRAFSGDAEWSRADFDYYEGFVGVDAHLSDNWHVKANASYVEQSNYFKTSSILGAISPVDRIANYRQPAYGNVSRRLFRSDLSVSGEFDALGRQHEILVGADYSHQDINFATFIDFTNPVLSVSLDDLETVTLPEPDESAFDPGYFTPVWNSEQYGAFGKVNISVAEPLDLIVGGRFTHYSSRVVELYQGGPSYAQRARPQSAFTPYGGLVFHIASGWNGLVTVLCRSPISLCHLGFERERTDAAQI